MMKYYKHLLLLLATGAACTGPIEPGELGPGFPDPGAVAASCRYQAPSGAVYYVDTDGSDTDGSGTQASPWASIAHALRQVEDGGTILVQPGVYEGSTNLSGSFDEGVTIRSAQLYAARLRAREGATMFCYDCAGITIEGFDIAHSGPGAGPLVVHIGEQNVERVVLRNNIFHDSYNNDLLKINNGASRITVERNIFYNQQGSDEHIDINSVNDVLVQDNIFLNDFAAKDRDNSNDTSSYIVIKDSNATDDQFLGAERVTVRRNIFLNWQGSRAYNFVLIGEDAADYAEARDILVENNLMIGNAPNDMRAPFGVKSGEDVIFRNNTVAGDMPGAAFAMRLNVENPAMQNKRIHFYNNIWSDPTGTMSPFSTTPPGETASFTLDNNLYWNAGAGIPVAADQLVDPAEDTHGVHGDPRLGAQDGLVVPVWDSSVAHFADGTTSTCDVFENLVTRYGAPGTGSAAVGAARADMAPDHDILGNARRSSPDIGAVEQR